LPVSVREVIGRRVARLGDDTVRTMGVAAVIGRDFDASFVANITSLSDRELAELFDRAVDAALIEEVPGWPGRYTFVHALIEHTMYDTLSANRRSLLHRQVAEALERVCGPDPGDRLGELAYHWIEAKSPQNAHKTIDYTRRAAERALDQLAPDEALRWYQQAVELYERAALTEDRLEGELLVGLGVARLRTGAAGAREALLDAARHAQQHNYRDLLIQAVLANTRGGGSDIRGVDTERVAIVEAVITADTDDRERAQLLAVLAAELNFAGDHRRCQALADDALTLARRAGDPHTLMRVLGFCVTQSGLPDRLTQDTRMIEELDALAHELGDPYFEMIAARLAGAQAIRRGDVAEADSA
jgi:hypothetical protein